MRNARRDRIEMLVRERHTADIGFLAKELGVSEMTIRRDLRLLERDGRVLRLHGCAVAPRDSAFEPPYAVRMRENAARKMAIGRYAATLVEPGDVVIIDVGTTLLELAQRLPEDKQVTAVTNWIPVVEVLARKSGIKVMLTGGLVRLEELSTTGTWAGDTFKNVNADKTFLGVGGISPERGFTDYDLAEAEVKRAMMSASRETFVLADSSKFGRVAPFRVPLTEPVTVITDMDLEPGQVEAWSKMGGVTIVRVGQGETDRREKGGVEAKARNLI